MHISLSLQGLISMPLKLQHRHLHRIAINGKKMTRCLGSMTGASILATDDLTWAVRYLVVDTSRWLSRRHVIFATGAVREPDWEK
jgi:hypothetical protein